MATQTNTLFFEDKPLFGLDIGSGAARVVQLETTKAGLKLIGYGQTTFPAEAITAGVITKPEVVAEAVQGLFKDHLVGDITTHRLAVALPINYAFTRFIDVTELADKELAEAVQNEVEQYIPAPSDELYIDYTSVKQADKTNLFIAAMPKKIVDSYLLLSRLLGLESVVFQTSSGASAHLFARDTQSDVPAVLIDFGSISADITVYDNGPVLNGTVASGGEQFTMAIMKALDVTYKEATLIKTKYGLSRSKKQAQIEAALDSSLVLIIKEIKRTIRYYEEHAGGGRKISQIVITGGGANMPGLAECLTNTLRLAVRTLDPTSYLDFAKLQPFSVSERMSFVTAVGLATIVPSEVFA